MRRFNVGEDCPVFDGLYDYVKIYTGGSIDGYARQYTIFFFFTVLISCQRAKTALGSVRHRHQLGGRTASRAEGRGLRLLLHQRRRHSHRRAAQVRSGQSK